MTLFQAASPRQKLLQVEVDCHRALLGQLPVTETVGRDLEVKNSKELPPREGLSKVCGRARLLHDMANIELQAMELALRTLAEFPLAPTQFREELAALVISESTHLRMCLDGTEELGQKWGDWPVHLGLWRAVSKDDSLIDRILIVHRYLEGSGLDAGTNLLRRLEGLPVRDISLPVIAQIHREEIPHVDFGSRWYRELCRAENIDPSEDFEIRMNRLRMTLPYRTEQIAIAPRLAAGFTMEEIAVLERWRTERPRVSTAGGR